jgi:hypothetical protein
MIETLTGILSIINEADTGENACPAGLMKIKKQPPLL